jgi:[ribosomal protein S18]-alanine N-acetyltransferase
MPVPKADLLFPALEARVVEIAAALPGDAQEIAGLHARELAPGWPAHEIERSCADATRLVLKAQSDGALAGFAILQFTPDEAELLAIAIERAKRRRGIASKMLDTALAACVDKAIERIFLEVAESNEPAIKLYSRFGFKVVGRRPGYYEAARSAPENALIMGLDRKRGLSQIVPQRGRES